MAKKSKKRFPRWRKGNSGCMWGLISMFDFRQGRSTQRMLSGKKHDSARSSGMSSSRNNGSPPCNMVEKHGDDESLSIFSETEAEETDTVNLGVANTNTFMEEMPSVQHKELSSNIEWKKNEFGHGPCADRNNNEAIGIGLECSKDKENSLSASQSLIYQQSDYPNVSEILSPNFDLNAFMANYCKSSFQSKVNQLEFDDKTEYCPFQNTANESLAAFQKALVDLTVACLRQESINSSKLVGCKEIQQTTEFTNALDLLDSNKDLLLKLLQDPNSSIRKHMQDLQNVYFSRFSTQNQSLGELPVAKQLQKQSGHFFFRKRDRVPLENQSVEGADAKVVNRIVVLKPSPSGNQNPSNVVSKNPSLHAPQNLKNKGDMEKFSSHFSLKEIKRRLINAVGANRKDRHPIAMDGIMHKIPYGKGMTAECGTRRRGAGENGEKESSVKEAEKKINLPMASKIVDEHMAQVQYREAAFYDEARKHLAESLRIGSDHESLASIQVSNSLGRMLSFPGFNYLSPRLGSTIEKESVDASLFLCHSSEGIDMEHSDPSKMKSQPDDDNSQETKNEIKEATEANDFMQIEEQGEIKILPVPFTIEDDLPSGMIEEDESSVILEVEHSKEELQPSIELTPIASSSVKTEESRDAECSIENVGRPSPISVLERLYFEDVNSPSSMISENWINVERQMQIKEPQISIPTAASDSIDSEASLITCIEFDEASIFDDLEVSYGSLVNDPKLLFDSIDEVLAEIKLRHFSCTPWVSLIRPNLRMLQKQRDIVREACRKMNWHLDVQIPSTMEQAVGKDLDGGVWIDFHIDSENTINEIGNEILDHLFEETALEMWD
ncbi:hypothetical protein HPP92_014791 [Vanilla planifolia]|uniref:DUF4378 domain-containing protein n=1 Tax=Vanilla planifolia TaxID=51239 RepID=A0A835QNB8_VANPL|nr:hypothetical protein HPP92_014791 [Vanilla planifolia]